MPIPKPRENETKDEFLDRCLSFLADEGTTGKVAVAICHTQWRRVHGGKAPSKRELENR